MVEGYGSLVVYVLLLDPDETLGTKEQFNR